MLQGLYALQHWHLHLQRRCGLSNALEVKTVCNAYEKHLCMLHCPLSLVLLQCCAAPVCMPVPAMHLCNKDVTSSTDTQDMYLERQNLWLLHWQCPASTAAAPYADMAAVLDLY